MKPRGSSTTTPLKKVAMYSTAATVTEAADAVVTGAKALGFRPKKPSHHALPVSRTPTDFKSDLQHTTGVRIKCKPQDPTTFAPVPVIPLPPCGWAFGDELPKKKVYLVDKSILST
jgi:hypothetical protein